MNGRILTPPVITASAAGPKAATLARAIAASLPVPPFIVLAADAYREHVARGATALDLALLAELERAAAPLGPRLAVRSSGTAEDLPGLSFAGQYESVCDVAPADLERAVLTCWASVNSERAVAYRERNNIPHESAAMAVIVQRFVEPQAGGVAFTADPVTGERRVVVESCAEGAEAIVSGRVSPGRAVFERNDLAGSDLDRQVARLALAAEDLLGAPADIEWAYAEGRLWLLQARPITTIPSAGSASAAPPDRTTAPSATTSSHRPTAWSNVNTAEVLPDVVTPMTWSIVGKVATGLIDALFSKLGIRVDESRLVSLIGGRAYFNASLLGSAFEQLPVGGDITTIFGGADAPPGFTDLPPAPEDLAQVSRLRVLLGLPRMLAWVLSHSPTRADELCATARADVTRGLADLSRATTEDEIAEVTTRLATGLGTLVDAVAFAGVVMMRHASFVKMAERHFGAGGAALANELLAGQGGVASAESGLALARLGRFARAHPLVADALRSSNAWAEVRARLEAFSARTDAPAAGVADSVAVDGSVASSFLHRWDSFMAEHGHHGSGELELGAHRWAESPDSVLATVVGLLGMTDATDLVAAHEARGKRAGEREAEALAKLRSLARWRFARALERARDGARMRENLKSEGVRYLAAGRKGLLVLGERMAARGLIDSADDIFFLTFEDIAPVRAGTLDAHPLVTARRAEYRANRAVTPPAVVIGEWDGRAADSAGAGAGAGAGAAAGAGAPSAGLPTLTGLGVAAGVARGPARVIHSVFSTERVLPGEVLVAPVTDPGWTPHFLTASAIVVDMGGMLSHGSIIAREYGIPGVVNVGNGTSVISTGDIVEVDGSAGVVRVVARAGGAG